MTHKGMKRDDFEIGMEFLMGEGRWRVTDVGTRIVTAIRIDRAQIVEQNKETGERRLRTIPGLEAERAGWFNGPPYACLEHVVDENDMKACSPVPERQS
jgi:hypothetical protein